MGAVLSIIAGAGINAVAFSGSNYVFNKLSSHGEAETKGHNRAIEKLQKDQDSWYKERQQRLDFINERLQKEKHAEKTFKDVDEAMQAYYFATQHKLTPIRKYPELSDHYHPSEKQKNGEIIFILGGLGLLGYIMYKYL